MTEQQTRVNNLITRVERHQEALGMSNSAFVERYRKYLGSTKSWTDRLQARNWDDIGGALKKWEQKLTALVGYIDGHGGMDEYYPSLPLAWYVKMMFSRLQGATTDRRCLLLIAPSGVGKSAALRHLYTEHPQDTAYVDCNETMRNSKQQLVNAMANAVGSPLAGSSTKTFADLIEHLKGLRLTLLFDEAHEGGVLLLKLIKTLINQTPSSVIVSLYPTSWHRLINGSNEAYAEAQQLLGRTVKPIETRWLAGLNDEDVEAYLQASTASHIETPEDVSWKELIRRTSRAVAATGNLRGLADAVESAKILADEEGKELTPARVEKMILTFAGGQS